MGRTGCGKTTLLEAICGLRPRAGRDASASCGRDVTRLKPAERGIGYVPQDRALFPTMTVCDHLAFALERPPLAAARRSRSAWRSWPTCSASATCSTAARRPQRRRVAARRPGRALAAAPRVLLLDEPLSALDDRSRGEMHDLLVSVRPRTAVTALHVTHHAGDAERLADRVLVMENGVVRTGGAPCPTKAAGGPL